MRGEGRDLRALDPAADALGWEGLVGRINRAAAPELERRRTAASPILLLTEWTRPTLALAASIAAVAASIFLLPQRSLELDAIAIGFGLPIAVEEWLATGQPPALEELVYAYEGDSR